MTIKYGDGGRLGTGVESGKLVARYVHSGNKVVQPISLDTTTGIWTCSGGLNTLVGANGTVVSCVGRCTTYTNNIIPRELRESDSSRLQVLSDSTFYIQAGTTNILSYPDGSNSANNLSKIRFELTGVVSATIDISSFDMKEIVFRAYGSRGRLGWSYLYVEGTHDGGNYSAALTILDGKNFSTQFQEQYTRYDKVSGVFIHQGLRSAIRYWTSANGTWTTSGAADATSARLIENFSNFKYTSIRLNFDCCNDYALEIYDQAGY